MITELMNQRIRELGIYSIFDLEKHYHTKARGHWFDKDTMAFFKCRLSSILYFGTTNVYFVSSERFNGSTQHPRLYTVRSYNPETGQIDTVGDFQGYNTNHQAKKMADILAYNEWKETAAKKQEQLRQEIA